MKSLKLKIIIIVVALISFNQASASIVVVKKKRVSIKDDAIQPIDDSYINSLDEDSMFEKVTGSYDGELDFLDELAPDTTSNKINRSISSTTELSAEGTDLPN